MASNILPKVEYTPEYSDELLGLVVELYKDEIRHHLNELQLSKMIDLIDVAQYNIEQYSESLVSGNFNRCLKYYIVGLFYVYLIIPNSIQFQIKNKNFEIFTFLKQLYEKETNMSNVKLQVINYISYLNEKHHKLKQEQSQQMKLPKRSSTMPSSSLQHDLTQFLLSNEVRPPNQLDEVVSSTNSSVVSLSSDSSDSSLVEEWSPPNLQPDDQLKLVDDANTDTLDTTLLEETYTDLEDTNKTITVPSIPAHAPPPPPPPPPLHTLKHVSSFPVNFNSNGSKPYCASFADVPVQFPANLDDEEQPTLKSFSTKATHRKDSYQSVYANDDEGDVLTIDSKGLYTALSKGEESFLLFDIRPKALFEVNHIPYDNLIQLDPSIVLNSSSYQEFEDSLKIILQHDDFMKIKNLKRFNSIVSYSDNKTFFQNKHDYIIKFANLLNEIDAKPKTLSGGFNQWLSFINKTHLNNNELNFKSKVPIFNIPEVPSVPSVPAPPLPSSNLQPLEQSPSFDYNRMFPQRASIIPTPVRSSPSPTSQVSSHYSNGNQLQTPSLIPIGRAPVATPAFQNQTSSTFNYQRPAQPVPQYPVNNTVDNLQHPYPMNNYYKQNSLPSDSNIHTYHQQQLQQQQQHHQYQQPYQSQPQFYQQQNQYQPSKQHIPQQAPPILGQYQNAPRTRSRAVPTIQSSSHPFVRLSITGLRNMKNTCYINSMIQCLFESRNFRSLFLDFKYQDYYNMEFFNSDNNRIHSSHLTGHAPDPNIRLSSSLAKLFEKMYLNGGCSIVPSGFLKNCVHLRPDFNIPFEQQDTQEFLMFLLDRLHDELSNSNKVINDHPELLDFDKEGKLGKDYEKWFNTVLIKQGFSPISQNFQGQLQDSLTCMKCGFKSSNYSSFFMLSLGIPKKSAKNGKKLKKIYLEDCIDLFTNDEILTGENAWDCPKCSNKSKDNDKDNISLEKETRRHRLHFTKSTFKFRGRSSSPAASKLKSDGSNDSLISLGKKNSTIKSLTFVTLPPTLIIHLSRFLFYDTSQKDDSIIQYPLILTIMHNDEPVRYRLFGVVNHSGTLKSGHYTSIANKNLAHDLERPDWYYFDDEVVKDTKHGRVNSGDKDAERMGSSNVYVLFYEKI